MRVPWPAGKRRGVPTPQEVLDALKRVSYPGYTRDIVSFGLIKDIHVSSDGVRVELAPTTAQQDVIAKHHLPQV